MGHELYITGLGPIVVMSSTSVRKVAWNRSIMLLKPTVNQSSTSCSVDIEHAPARQAGLLKRYLGAGGNIGVIRFKDWNARHFESSTGRRV